MRKKQLQLYRPIKDLNPPYLTPQQLSEFQSEFTLFDRQLSVKKLFDAMTSQNITKSDKLALPFINQLKNSGKDRIGFEEYITAMVEYFQHNCNLKMIYEMLGEGESGELSRRTISQVLLDALGREPQVSEINTALEELKRQECRDNTKAKNMSEEEQVKKVNEYS